MWFLKVITSILEQGLLAIWTNLSALSVWTVNNLIIVIVVWHISISRQCTQSQVFFYFHPLAPQLPAELGMWVVIQSDDALLFLNVVFMGAEMSKAEVQRKLKWGLMDRTMCETVNWLFTKPLRVGSRLFYIP